MRRVCETAAMVGRVVVGQAGDPGWEGALPATADVSAEALAAVANERHVSEGRGRRVAAWNRGELTQTFGARGQISPP